MKKTILIIGSSGFIGSKLKKKLVKNYKLINLNKSDGFDISKKKNLKKYLNVKIDYILNLSGQINQNYNSMKKTIIKGNENIINFCKKKKTLVYFFSTSLVYGYSSVKKKETSQKKPICKYSNLKHIAEKKYIESNINYKILRLCHIYDDKKNGVIKNLIGNKLKEKYFYSDNIETYRNYLFVEDLVNLICKIIKKGLKRNVYNIGFENIKMKTMIKSISDKSKKKIRFKNRNINLKKIPSQKIDCDQIYKEIHYKPKIKLISYLASKMC